MTLKHEHQDASGCLLPLLIPFVVATDIYFAFVASKLWLWFAVPLSIPAIPAVHFYGLVCLVDAARSWRWVSKLKETPPDIGDSVLTIFVRVFGLSIALLSGYFAKGFVP